MTRGTQLEIRPAALIHNAERAAQLAGDAAVYAMIKANGYGHGLTLVAHTLRDYVGGFGVAVIEEAVALRESGIESPLMLLEGCFDEGEWRLAQQLNLEVVVHNIEQINTLAAAHLTDSVAVWLKVDTGMHRLGVPAEQVPTLVQQLSSRSEIQLIGLMTHFACADMADDHTSENQLRTLRSLAEQFALPYSAANSAALFQYSENAFTGRLPESSQGARVRPGIMLYGASPVEGQSSAALDLQVTQQFSARLIAVNCVQAGEAVGYGATWLASRDSRIGIVAVGYGDGYPRHASNGAPVAVAGMRTRTVGRVSMDMIAIDLTEIVDAKVGDRVELWGDLVSIDEVAAFCGTISYELFCQVTARVHRVITHGKA
ncbi:MAG: alanine racemase [Gammaproteobacteria bacterium]|nr:alanine racemase [Gammaproteobacteria bacterium]MBQ0775063.1 alanine racemase [Gammaproteobacteria bacterium]|tara:strand:- start:124747 stop:125865 length:1119 start_codon:yes stop_codon:yes gene_type:complete